MNVKTIIAAASFAVITTGAQAQNELLIVDLSVADTITITAGSGVSAADSVGSNFTGVLLENFFDGPLGVTLASTLVSGDLNTVADGGASDGSPSLFGLAGNAGLNIWSFSFGTPSFVAGTAGFSGSGTWTTDSATYNSVFALGARTGDIYNPADTDDDIAGADLIGTYSVVVPSPAAFSLMGLGLGLGAARRRR
ncbi:MAG: hypothetical protein AB8F26_09150 [Phycisphaerales bacterium]